jgi:hypothetical protein
MRGVQVKIGGVSSSTRARSVLAGFAAVMALIVALPTIGLAQSGTKQPPCFTSIINPGGWPIPKHGKALKPGPSDWPGVPPEITFTEFALDPKVLTVIPHYYVENNALVLYDFYYRGEGFTRFEAKGKPFAYTMFALGKYTGDAFNVWWVDLDGDGKFTSLQWELDFKQLPEWVRKRLSE